MRPREGARIILHAAHRRHAERHRRRTLLATRLASMTCLPVASAPSFRRGLTMRWLTQAGWPGNLLALAAGALTPLALAPFDLWPLALLSIALLYLGLRELTPRQAV